MENKLEVLISESGLEQTKGQVLLDNFANYFQIASEWEKKAKNIVVKDASQQTDMQMARVGRLFLREKRIQLEKTRKELKEQSLREGKAIDGIANILKALIVPIEEYLGKQEKFVEIKAKEIAELARVEMERKAEEDRLAKEEAERKEQERIRLENEKLKKEAIAKEKKMQVEREKAEAKQEKLEEKARLEREEAEAKRREIQKQARIARDKAEIERRALEDKARKEKFEAERKARIEKEKQNKIITEQKKKAEAERISKLKIEAQAGLDRELAKKAKAEQQAKLEAEKKEREKIQARLDELIECPFCGKEFVIGAEVCPICHGEGSTTDHHDPCDNCDGKGYIK